MTDARKQDIAARFDHAARYDDAAHVQRRCVVALMDEIARILARRPAVRWPLRVLEIGCGTGFLTAPLAALLPDAALCVTDIAPGMIDRLRAAHPGIRADFRVMDGEHPAPDLPGPFDLIVSSLCVQWFTDRRAGFARLCDRLAPGGALALTTLLDGTLAEWRAACALEATPCGVADYPTRDTLEREWPPGGTGCWRTLTLHDPAPDARGFLRGLHHIGASRPAEAAQSASPGALRRAMARFDRANVARHVTYEIGIGFFERVSA